MAPPNPKRPPRPPRPPGTQAPKDSDVELPFDEDEVDPLQADDPRPQRVPQFPAGSRRSRRQDVARGHKDQEQSPRFDWSHEYSDPGHPPAFLYVERGPGVGQLVPVKQGLLVMGRSSSADLRLQHPSISRRHAQLTRRADRFFVKDLSSQNGTFLNRGRVTGEAEVMPGDEIAMGNALLRLRGPGCTPVLGIPVVTASNTVPDGVRKQGKSPLRVALTAAALGSAVAALITVISGGLSRENTPGSVPPPPSALTGPSTPVTQLATLQPRPASTDTGAPTSAEIPPGPMPTAVDAAGRPLAPATAASPTGAAPVAPSPPDAAPASPGASGDAPTSAIDMARGGAPSREEAAASPSAMDVARGMEGASTSRQELAPSARDVAAGGAQSRTGMASPAEVEVLRRYEAGEVQAARERAKAAKLTALSSQLDRFESSKAGFRKALKKRDLSRAISHLTAAVRVDEALASGRSRHGPQLRKQLADLHVQSGASHARAGRKDAARAAFEQALKYDADHRDARTRLARLSGVGAP